MNLERDPKPKPEKQPPPDDYDAVDDFAKSIDEAYRVIRERKANGGKGWGDGNEHQAAGQ